MYEVEVVKYISASVKDAGKVTKAKEFLWYPTFGLIGQQLINVWDNQHQKQDLIEQFENSLKCMVCHNK